MKKLLFLAFLCSQQVFPCNDFLRKYPEECQMSDQYQALHKEMYDTYGVNVEFLTGYRSRRLIDKKVWEEEQDRIRCRPEKAYLPDPDVWVNWEKGASFLSNKLLDERLKNETISIDRDFIKDVNIQSVNIDIMGLMATKVKGAAPGRIRQNFHEIPGFTYSCMSGAVTSEHIENVSNDYDLLDDNGNPLVSAIGHTCPDSDYQQGVLKYTATANVDSELKKLLSYIKVNLDLYRRGENRADYGPLKFIADVQRWFVAIHPFGDGNGRTSRFLQDYLLAKFGLPYAPSGNLQNDVLMRKESYQDLFANEMKQTMDEIKGCKKEIGDNGLDDLENLSCNCRPMYFDERPYPKSVRLAKDPCQSEELNGSTRLLQDNEEFMFNIMFALENDSF